MASRYSAARPKRDGEVFARTHHHDVDNGISTAQGKFDVRNPSALAPDAQEEDAILEADVIGGSAAVKRGAVNIDGYDSDSDYETFDARANARFKKDPKKRDVSLFDQLENYNPKATGSKGDTNAKGDNDDDDDDDPDIDMFAPEPADKGEAPDDDAGVKKKKRKREVQFLGSTDIKGQDLSSRNRSHISVAVEDESSDDLEEVELAIQEEGVDEEVGAGGLKRHAPKIEAFNMVQELEDGAFDQDGNYIRKAVDAAAEHDRWLEGVGKKEIRRAAAAHERREADARRRRQQEEQIQTADLLDALIGRLEPTETPLEALVRLGKRRTRHKKKAPPIKQRRLKKGTGTVEPMDVDGNGDEDAAVDNEQALVKEAIDAITVAADGLLSRDHPEIYDQERELLMRLYRREAGCEWTAKKKQEEEQYGQDSGGNSNNRETKMWEYRWTDGRDGSRHQGPFDEPTMKAWQDAGYFGEGVEFRALGSPDGWTQHVSFKA